MNPEDASLFFIPYDSAMDAIVTRVSLPVHDLIFILTPSRKEQFDHQDALEPERFLIISLWL
jgi:hypothetical protein